MYNGKRDLSYFVHVKICAIKKACSYINNIYKWLALLLVKGFGQNEGSKWSLHRKNYLVWENKIRYINFMIVSLLSLQLLCCCFAYEMSNDCEFFSIAKFSWPFSAYVYSLFQQKAYLRKLVTCKSYERFSTFHYFYLHYWRKMGV